jgi:hypothetical protein
MKNIAKPIVFMLALVLSTMLAQSTCPDMGADSWNNIQSCSICGLGLAKTNGITCSYSHYSSLATIDCSTGNAFNVDPIASGAIDTDHHHLSNCVDYTGGHCNGGICDGATAGVQHVVTVNIWYSFPCAG